LNFLNKNKKIIQLNWVKNEGSYRKLLPLLREKWHEDCIIITIDDDTVYHSQLIENMVKDYNNHKCVIGYFGFSPDIIEKNDKLENFSSTKHGKYIKKHLYNFTYGKGGILYKPKFFYKTNKLIFDRNFYMKICDKQDDLWFYILRIKNNIECFLDYKKYMVKDLSNQGLYDVFNGKNNNNTIVFKKIIEELKLKNKF
jgi:hypothetical protein